MGGFWYRIGVIGPPKTIYESGYFLSTMCFPSDYPFNPPSFKFNRPFFHPNVGEKAEERWNPTQTVESILLSVVSLLNDPNCSSPANVDAGVMYRQDHDQYCLAVKNQVEISRRDIPDGYELPTSDEHYAVRKPVENTIEDEDFWYDEDEEDLEDEDED
ncbi:hypothetical protein BDEG_23205 [Batrachochytrium dendrobatidis JEL423]|uniref:UBC core domain-containing protein n=1 Tax=Batrachochytrium dendrobatidis (strain JEL423) TaxID=403673 RepID=A0A177WHS5_BATDL|nr:hypothetical protein BDEG_23205 [Batrachochytrium dendrobatidis JEL423]